MKHSIEKSVLVFLILNFSFLFLHSQELKSVPNNVFTRGEQFKFKAYYDSFVTGKVTAGVASLEIKFENKKIDGRNTYHIIGTGKSKGAFNFFFKVDDLFETFMDEEYLVPWTFSRRTSEGGYVKDDDVRFNQYSGSVSSRTANKKIKIGTHDILSAFFYARTFDLTNMKVGERFPLDFFLDDSVYVSMIEFSGREDVTTKLGTFHCLKFKPMVATGNVFSQPYPMNIWISDDQNRIPILARSEVVVGSVKLELIDYKGLANPLSSQVGK